MALGLAYASGASSIPAISITSAGYQIQSEERVIECGVGGTAPKLPAVADQVRGFDYVIYNFSGGVLTPVVYPGSGDTFSVVSDIPDGEARVFHIPFSGTEIVVL